MIPHVAVIDPGLRVAELDCFNRISRRSPLRCTYHLPAMFGLDSLRRAEAGLAAVIVLGSGASVNDSLGWQDGMIDWLRPRLAADLPYLGLCYGHQLLAAALGGRVDFLFPDREKRKGLREIRLDADPLWGAATHGPVLVSHREGVVGLPSGASVVGRSDEVAVEALRLDGRRQWGLQSHPEATPAFALNNDVPFSGDPAVLQFGNRLVDAFLDRVAAG
jgi:GMP synthase-like glutamine amidotransferase